jgi:putative serine protease PepD
MTETSGANFDANQRAYPQMPWWPNLPPTPQPPAAAQQPPAWPSAAPGGRAPGGRAPGGRALGGRAPHRWARRIAATTAVAVLALGGGAVGGAAAVRLGGDSAVVAGLAAPASAAAASTRTAPASLAQVAAAVAPSVVSIQVDGRDGSATGSGVILSADGDIVTNAHVVAGAGTGSRITVTLSDGRTAPATVVGSDSRADIAVVHASGVTDLKPATIGSSGDIAAGDTVLAFGSPLGLDGSVSAGIVSALHRSVTESGGSGLADLIQTDAAINPGNSGGPLVDTAGRVIGINTVIATTDSQGGNIGLGFAIPIESALAVATQLRAG